MLKHIRFQLHLWVAIDSLYGCVFMCSAYLAGSCGVVLTSLDLSNSWHVVTCMCWISHSGHMTVWPSHTCMLYMGILKYCETCI